nr:MAG TPA: hypothetical protein [Caudoviricetes sp.]
MEVNDSFINGIDERVNEALYFLNDILNTDDIQYDDYSDLYDIIDSIYTFVHNDEKDEQ